MALVSSNQDEAIAKILSSIYEGGTNQKHAVSVASNDSYFLCPQHEFCPGYSFERGYLSPYFANAEKEITYGEKDSKQVGAYLYLCDYELETQ